MAESRPRDLTQEELALIRSSAAGSAAETEPLRVPPGTEIAVEMLNPAMNLAENASPTAGPPTESVDASAGKAPSAPATSGKKKEK
jgi:hypothetical protein